MFVIFVSVVTDDDDQDRRRRRRGHDGQRHRAGVRAGRASPCGSSTSRSRCSIARAATIEKSLGEVRREGQARRRPIATRRSAGSRPSTDARRARRRRLRRRSDRRERRREARRCSRRLDAHHPARRDPRVEHVVDLDHAARRGDEAAGQSARHALHEPGAADDAGRADPRPGHVGRVDARPRRSCARRSARRRSKRPTIPASSPTAS